VFKSFTNLTRTLSLLGLFAALGVTTGATAAQPNFRANPSARLGGMSAVPRGPSLSQNMGMKTAPQFNQGDSFKNQSLGNVNTPRVFKPSPIVNDNVFNGNVMKGNGIISRKSDLLTQPLTGRIKPPLVSVQPRPGKMDLGVFQKEKLNPALLGGRNNGIKTKLPGLVNKKPILNPIKLPGLVNNKPILNPIKLPGIFHKKPNLIGAKLPGLFHHNDPWCHPGKSPWWSDCGPIFTQPCYDPCYYPCYDPCYDPCFTYDLFTCYPTYPVVVSPVVIVEVPAPAADLIITDLVQVEPGDAANNAGPLLRITVKNKGTLASGKFGLGAYASLKAEPNENMVANGQELEALAAGESRTVEIRLPVEALAMRADAKALPEPFSKVFVVVDTKNTVTESDETNNMLPVEREKLIPVDVVANANPLGM